MQMLRGEGDRRDRELHSKTHGRRSEGIHWLRIRALKARVDPWIREVFLNPPDLRISLIFPKQLHKDTFSPQHCHQDGTPIAAQLVSRTNTNLSSKTHILSPLIFRPLHHLLHLCQQGINNTILMFHPALHVQLITLRFRQWNAMIVRIGM